MDLVNPSTGSINTLEVFEALFGQNLPSPTMTDALGQLVNQVQTYCQGNNLPKRSNGAINNARGAWYELLHGVPLWNMPKPPGTVIVRLPSKRDPNLKEARKALAFADLLGQADRGALLAIQEAYGLEMPNPDLICVADLDPSLVTQYFPPIQNSTVDELRRYRNGWQRLRGRIGAGQIKFAISMKNSLRGDRRHLVYNDANIFKALMTGWQRQPESAKFYLFAGKIGMADHKVLDGKALHSVSAWTSAIQAIDGSYQVVSPAQSLTVVQSILQATFPGWIAPPSPQPPTP